MDTNVDYQLAAERALATHFGLIQTKPMGVEELAKIFGVNRNKMPKILKAMIGDGAKKFGSTWRVPLFKMPPEWLRDNGWLPASRAAG